jgi:hypothetical protein
MLEFQRNKFHNFKSPQRGNTPQHEQHGTNRRQPAHQTGAGKRVQTDHYRDADSQEH